MKKAMNIICSLCFLLLAGAAVGAGVRIEQLHMLAPKYLYPLLAVLLVLAAVPGALMLPRSKQAARISGCVLAVLLSTALIGGALAVGKVHETMDAITTVAEPGAVVEVYAKAGTLETLEDVSILGWTDAFDGENTAKALEALTADRDLTVRQYPAVPELVEALYAGEVDGILLSSAYVGILETMETYAGFSEQTVVLHSQAVARPKQPEPEKPAEPAEPEETGPDRSENAFLIYLSGADTRSQGMTAGLSDVNLLAAVNPDTRQAVIINTPRDFFVPNSASGTGALDKLTHCGAYGVQCSMDALSGLYREKINYYARINFTGFETLIDALGGVTVQSDVDFWTGGRHFVVGPNEVNGEQALNFARHRHSFATQDLQRGQNQMKLIMAIVDKATSGSAIITNYPQIMESLQGMFLTNVPREELEYLVRLQLEDMSPWDIKTYYVNGTSDMQHTYSTGNYQAYVMWPNEASLVKARALIDAVFTGQPITPDMLTIPEAPPLPKEEE